MSDNFIDVFPHFRSCSEEVPLYTPKGKRAAAAHSQYPPGWHPTPAASNVTKPKTEKPKAPPGEKVKQPQSDKPKPQQGDKIKIKERKAEPATKVDPVVEEISKKLSDVDLSSASDVDPTIEISKKLKRLRRRLREAEQLEEKILSGEVTNSDQLEKISRRKEFEEEIEQLESERLKLRQLKGSTTT